MVCGVVRGSSDSRKVLGILFVVMFRLAYALVLWRYRMWALQVGFGRRGGAFGGHADAADLFSM
jgi:hypothetical protein